MQSLEGHAKMAATFKEQQGHVPPLAHDWTQFAYTDGSHINTIQTDEQPQPDDNHDGAEQPAGSQSDSQTSETDIDPRKKTARNGPGIGTGVFFHGHPPVHIHCRWDGQNADPQCNTINRAELAGIDYAIRDDRSRRADESTHIATDSLCSMHAVVRAITRPQDLTEHRHLHILQRIGQAIRDAPGTVHIWKVKSHIGIVGNEKADAAAVSVAKGESAATYTYATPSHDRRHIHWPHKTSTHHSKDGTATPAAAPLADMNASLKTIAHNNSKYGGAATDGIYSTAWRGVASQVNHKLSHLFLTHKDIGLKISKPVMQYRWGRLPTNNWLHKIGISPTNKCPLCGEVDGGHHVVSGCKAHQKAYVQRHNEAGTEILEAISKGTKGHCVMMSDVGFGKRRSPAENPEGMQPHRFVATATFPPHVGSALAAELHEYRASVPDILLVENDARNCETHFNIVEINTAATPTQAHNGRKQNNNTPNCRRWSKRRD
jgi:ribonuclease HI